MVRFDPSGTDLPIVASLELITAALADRNVAVLVAEPGAGKTTIVPLVLVQQSWCTGRVLVVEPRRVAARAAASRMAKLLGQEPGATVGWRMKDDTRVSKDTRIEVITDGVLTRMLQNDPSLDGISCVILDEFHERSLDVDLGLALCADAQSALRSDLRLLVMSATIDAAAVADLLANESGDPAPVIAATGRTYPVQINWIDQSGPTLSPSRVAEVVRVALGATTGDVLVFLPGAREIRATQRFLGQIPNTDVRQLHGSLSNTEQRDALTPGRDGRRKVVLATNIAETSLTIEGVTAVVDSGWARRPMLDHRRAIGGLTTARISRASADQRSGRAGRLGPGVAYRMWSQRDHALLDAHDAPEINQTDLVGLALDLARWGNADGSQLRWLDPPPLHAMRAARDLLEQFDFVDEHGHATPHGQRAAKLGMHPRFAHAVLASDVAGYVGTAAVVAALLSDRDIGDRRDTDLATRLQLIQRGGDERVRAVRREAQRIGRRLPGTRADVVDFADAKHLAAVVAAAYPDRIAQRRGSSGRYLLACGTGAALSPNDGLTANEWLAVAEVELVPDEADARILLAAPIDAARLLDVVDTTDTVVAEWDTQAGDVRVERQERIGAIVLKARPVKDTATAQRALLEGVRSVGLGLLGRIGDAELWRARVRFCRCHLGDEWPDVSDSALLASIDGWLAPELDRIGARRRADLAKVDVASALTPLVRWPLAGQLDDLAPTHAVTAKGVRRAIDYAGDVPMVSMRLQDAYGWTNPPRLAGGRVPLVVALLSPAGRPVQVTADLAGFWTGTWAQVRSEMRGRYPKHSWPEHPTTNDGRPNRR